MQYLQFRKLAAIGGHSAAGAIFSARRYGDEFSTNPNSEFLSVPKAIADKIVYCAVSV